MLRKSKHSLHFFFENRAVYEIMRDRPQVAIWHMHLASWIPKDTNTHSEYVVLIAFTLQQWLHEDVSMLRCTYIACLVYI